MDNPYLILNIPQTASKIEIHNAILKLQMENRKSRKYSGEFLIACQRILLEPYKRLAADFLFPSKLRSYRPKPIPLLELDNHKVDLNQNIFDSLPEMIKEYEKK